MNKFPVETLTKLKRDLAGAFLRFWSACFISNDDEPYVGQGRWLTWRLTAEDREGSSAAYDFEPFSSRHSVFFSAKKLTVVIETTRR